MNSTYTARSLNVGWEKRVVASLDELHLAAGEIVILAGPNGVGKSTVLKTMARQIQPIGGSLQLGGTDALAMNMKEFAQKVSYVPQLIEPGTAMTVAEFVALGRNPHQIWWQWEQGTRDKDAIARALEATETAALRDKLVHDLSGGERQRAAIAMALAQQATFMLLDEPTAHLDFKHQLQLVSLLKALRDKGLGVLIVLHDLNLIARLADRVVLLSTEGITSKIGASGSAEEVMTPEILRRIYEVNVAITTDAQTGIRSYVPYA